MRLTFASYNIHKGVGLDRRRDPDRILAVLHELDADVVALQEADMRFGSRAAVLPRRMLDERHWHVAALAMRPAGMAWHGNAILVRRGIEILGAEPIALPVLEPRGAVCARLRLQGREFMVAGMHLDLSGLLRRQQVRAICAQMARHAAPTVLMGDFNEWSVRGGALKAFGPAWNVLHPGRSFPSRSPLAQLDRIVHTREWSCDHAGVHHSALASVASDHLPVRAALTLSA
ncbi:MAG: endonuclease/exonuclease/phosphatase family protein [Croceibacterium sp.]